MRITFNAMHRNASANLEKAAERLMERQQQVSSGRRIEKPSDDPAGAARAVVERGEIGAVEQYERATNSVASRLTVVDTVLSDIVEKLTAAQAAAMSARGSSKTEIQRESAAQQLTGLRDALFDNLNSTFHGTYVFGGTNAAAAPYQRNPDGSVSAYQGTATAVEVDVDGGRAVRVAFNGEALAKGAEVKDAFTVLDELVAAARAGDDDALGAGIADLAGVFARATTLQSRVGADMRAVDDQKVRLSELRRAGVARLSAIEDTNMAEALTGMAQADAAYRAALGAAGNVTRLSLMDYLR